MDSTLQQFLDKTPETTLELTVQRILSTHSKTHVLQLERALRMLDKALYTTALKGISVIELYASITCAKAILCDGQQNESTTT